MKWSQVTQDERYINAPLEEKRKIKESWYRSNIESNPMYRPEYDGMIKTEIFGDDYTGALKQRDLSFSEKHIRPWLQKAGFIEGPTEKAARYQNYYNEAKKIAGRETKLLVFDEVKKLAKEQNIPIEKAYPIVNKNREEMIKRMTVPLMGQLEENWDAYVKGEYDLLTPRKANEKMMQIMAAAGIGGGIASAPISTAIGLATFGVTKQVANRALYPAIDYIKHKMNKQPYAYKVIENPSELLPAEATQASRDLLNVVELIGLGMITSGVLKRAPGAYEQTTKQIIEEHKLPKKVYFDSKQLRDMPEGELRNLVSRDLGLTGKQVRQALNNGIEVEYPAEKIIHLIDKPYWAKIKKAFKIQPLNQKSVIRGGEIRVGELHKALPYSDKITPPTVIEETSGSKIEQKSSLPLDKEKRLQQLKEAHARSTQKKLIKELTKPKEAPSVKESAPTINNVDPVGIETHKQDKPLRSEVRKTPKLYNVDIQLSEGVVNTYLKEEELQALNKAIQESYKTKKPAMFNGKPVAKIVGSYEVNQMKMHSGLPLDPALEAADKLYTKLDAMLDPVGTSPKDVARTIRQREIDQNVLVHNINEVKGVIEKLVPSKEDRAIITRYVEPGGEEAVGDRMSAKMLMAAELYKTGINKVGTIAKKYKVIKQVLDDYVAHLVKDPEATIEEVDKKIRWAMSMDKISKYVEAKHPRIRTESGEVMFPTIESLKAAGYEVISDDIAHLYEFTMRSEGIAAINAELAERLSKIKYVDPKHPKKELYQIMNIKSGDPVPKGYKLLRRGVFTLKWASPEAYNAISSIAEPSWGGKSLRKAVGILKQIKFMLPFYHGWNYVRNAIQARGLIMGMKTFYDGAKAMQNPEKVSDALKMGVNLFRINRMAGGITDEFFGKASKWNLPGKVSEALFIGMGDSLTLGLAEYYKDKLAPDIRAGKFTPKEAHELISDTVNSLSGNLSNSEMSRVSRELGRITLLARNWTYSNLRQGTGALGRHPKNWSKAQRQWATKMWAESIARMFLTLYGIANIINYMTTRHHYGKGRFCWENPKGRKLDPMLTMNKHTGREYYMSSWYGTVGDLIHWATRPVQTLAHKMQPALTEGMQQLVNTDFFTREPIQKQSDTTVEGLKNRLNHAYESSFPAGINPEKGKTPTPTLAKAVRLLGIAIGSSHVEQDWLDELYNFKEKKKYKTFDIDKKIYKALAEGDEDKAIDIIVDNGRYNSVDGIMSLFNKFQNLPAEVFNNMSKRDQIEFMEQLDKKEQDDFWNMIEGRQQAK